LKEQKKAMEKEKEYGEQHTRLLYGGEREKKRFCLEKKPLVLQSIIHSFVRRSDTTIHYY